jgi:5-methylcytosine-specific restriction endonuclease McrA
MAADKLCGQLRDGISKLEQELAALRTNPNNRAPITGVFRGGFTPEAKAVHDDLALQLAKLREKLDGKRYRLEGIEYPSLLRMREQLSRDFQAVDNGIGRISLSLERQGQKVEEDRRRAENERKKAQIAETKRAKAEQRAAMARAYEGKTREQADTVRRQLPRDHPCPYCYCQLDRDAHADHIHPVSKGGLSTVKNMVYACVKCNQKKGGLTLISFIVKFNLDAPQIFRNLSALGKDF